MKELKIPSKSLLKELIEFAEKESSNLELFEQILMNVDFKNFDEDKVNKIVKNSKDKWLKSNSLFKKKMKTIGEEDKKSSDSESGSESKEDDGSNSKSSESGSGESELPKFKFDFNFATESQFTPNNKKLILSRGNYSGWNCPVNNILFIYQVYLNKKIPKKIYFEFKIDKLHNDLNGFVVGNFIN
jgi:hypothetical protein